MPKRDFYEVLGVGRKDSPDEIKKAYKRLARQYHPDRNKGDKAAEERFKDVAEAYQVLGDAEKRAQYDRFGQAGFSGFDPTGAEHYYTYTPGGPGGVRINMEDLFGRRGKRSGRAGPGGIRDIFSEIFGFEDAPGGVPFNPDGGAQSVEAELTIDFDEAVRGGNRTLTLNVERPCEVCGGRGVSGRQVCGRCRGQGLISEPQTLTVKIPAGVRDGGKLRLRGKGRAGGDLHVVVHVRPHPLFRREGDDLHLEVPVTASEAALGAEITVPTLEGKATLKVPAGTQSGQMLRLRGKGMPRPNGSGRGDEYVRVQVTVPKHPDQRTQELFQEIAERNPENPRSHLVKE